MFVSLWVKKVSGEPCAASDVSKSRFLTVGKVVSSAGHGSALITSKEFHIAIPCIVAMVTFTLSQSQEILKFKNGSAVAKQWPIRCSVLSVPGVIELIQAIVLHAQLSLGSGL